jgi:hypothetical protein
VDRDKPKKSESVGQTVAVVIETKKGGSKKRNGANTISLQTSLGDLMNKHVLAYVCYYSFFFK